MLVLLTLALGATGCSSGPPPQVQTIDAVADTVDFSSVSDVVCDHHYTPSRIFPSGARFARYIKLSGSGHVDAVIAELEAEGFVLDADGKGSLFTDLLGPQGVRARIDVIEPPDDRIGTTFDDNEDDPCLIPQEGVTGIGFSLPS
jgi:hypothetical protein